MKKLLVILMLFTSTTTVKGGTIPFWSAEAETTLSANDNNNFISSTSVTESGDTFFVADMTIRTAPIGNFWEALVAYQPNTTPTIYATYSAWSYNMNNVTDPIIVDIYSYQSSDGPPLELTTQPQGIDYLGSLGIPPFNSGLYQVTLPTSNTGVYLLQVETDYDFGPPIVNFSAVPEPSMLTLIGLGLLGVYLFRKVKYDKQAR
jgi:hypothetical protein